MDWNRALLNHYAQIHLPFGKVCSISKMSLFCLICAYANKLYEAQSALNKQNRIALSSEMWV